MILLGICTFMDSQVQLENEERAESDEGDNRTRVGKLGKYKMN